MIDCISVENMRQSDAYTIENITPSLELMYRAALGVFQAVQWRGRTAIVVGSGNNGGDGFALACIMHKHNLECTVFTVSRRLSKDSAFYAQKAAEAGVTIVPYNSNCLCDYNIIVDCLLGTGFQGDVREVYREAIEAINHTNAYVISVDINSGMNGDTGEACIAVHSDVTVTIGYVKRGLISPNAGQYIKKLICADIGIILVKEEGKICTAEEWNNNVQKYSKDLRYCQCPAWLDMDVLRIQTDISEGVYSL